LQKSKGSLACVGLGMTLGSHITPMTKSHIDNSDICFVAASDALVELWVNKMHPNVISLQDYYAENKSRKITYREMVDVMLNEVRAGKKVCGIFYGHPGVFAYVPHQAIKEIRAEGYKAIMEPGISAEDCLIADLGIDPGKYGCQQYETSQFMFYKRVIDTSAYLFLWQIGVAGDLSHGINLTGKPHREILLELLYQHYPKDHLVILYEAATLPIKDIRAETIQLTNLLTAELKDYTTLVIPPSKPMIRNDFLIKQIKQI
jgi:precorrin-4 methylase